MKLKQRTSNLAQKQKNPIQPTLNHSSSIPHIATSSTISSRALLPPEYENEQVFVSWLQISIVLGTGSLGILALVPSTNLYNNDENVDVDLYDNSSIDKNESMINIEGDPNDENQLVQNTIYGLMLLPVALSFLIYALVQYIRRASMIRRHDLGPFEDIVGPILLTILLMGATLSQLILRLDSILK